MNLVLTLSLCCGIIFKQYNAGVMELADVRDSKSRGGNTVRVRPPPPAPVQIPHGICFFPFGTHICACSSGDRAVASDAMCAGSIPVRRTILKTTLMRGFLFCTLFLQLNSTDIMKRPIVNTTGLLYFHKLNELKAAGIVFPYIADSDDCLDMAAGFAQSSTQLLHMSIHSSVIALVVHPPYGVENHISAEYNIFIVDKIHKKLVFFWRHNDSFVVHSNGASCRFYFYLVDYNSAVPDEESVVSFNQSIDLYQQEFC